MWKADHTNRESKARKAINRLRKKNSQRIGVSNEVQQQMQWQEWKQRRQWSEPESAAAFR